MAFQFPRGAEFLFVTQYLLQFDDTVKFKLRREGRRTVLQVSTVNIPPFSYTTVDFADESERPQKIAAVEPHATSWAVNAAFFTSVLSCFSGLFPITLEVADDLSCVLLYQKKEDDTGVQVAQVGALHDLGPKLLVDHDVGVLYTIADVRNFGDIVRSVCAGDDERCDVFLRRVSSTECELGMQTSTVTSSLQLLLDECNGVSKRLEGSARCTDLQEYARLCTRMTKLADKTSLMVGFGSDGIALFRFEWVTERGSRTADLFFCTS
ncbi:hypothetical protein conserved [Leishmania donovani]|uniref:Hypothetical_protein_conserved n=1 Tax=Leishmania donovani TaxID=5661 RepID=A0A3Q8IGM7_LEIDO|nr:hypothetical protein, conserved [Leishmania donovani]AYU82153.1 hypothetical protein LdCL_330024200 [Leishmania donovani]CAJ1992156.1 hypothetical protein conserved [Leishmania donovani]CBZ37318.1 hypothetical protein, conserved [Leishmania donovani]VDZ47993.1 hypothetical_protein_conserved [Leishmania donovani]